MTNEEIILPEDRLGRDALYYTLRKHFFGHLRESEPQPTGDAPLRVPDGRPINLIPNASERGRRGANASKRIGRPPGAYHKAPITAVQILERKAKGETYADIARSFGVHKSVIGERVKKWRQAQAKQEQVA